MTAFKQHEKKICILHTGGTIGMVPTPQGYAPKEGYLKSVITKLPELHHEDMPYLELVELQPLLDSSNVALREWNHIGEMIATRYNDFDGFVVLHGTDTMAYTSSALSFMLHNLAKPVVLTGSQIPIGELRSDARDNLLTAILIAARDDIHEVCLYFGGKLFRGTRATKLSADAMLAFDSPNYPPLAICGIDITVDNRLTRKKPLDPFYFEPFKKNAIAVLKVFPGIQFSIFQNIITDGLKGLVLEAFGAGNIPMDENNSLLHILEKARECHTAVVVCTQCLRGSARLGLYETSLASTDNPVISGQDMTVEAAIAKLYYLLGHGLSGEELRINMEKNLCGECT